MVNKNSLTSYLRQAKKIRKPYINIRFYKLYSLELVSLKNQNIILDYKILNSKLIINLNLNAKL